MKEILTALPVLSGAFWLWRKKKISGKGAGIIVLFVVAGISYCLLFGFSGQERPVSEVQRGEKGSDSKKMEFRVQTESEGNSKVVLDIPAVQMEEREREELLLDFCHRLDEEILGENASFSEICYPLNLLDSYSDSPVQVFWQTDAPEYLDREGKLGPTIPEEGVSVILKGELQLEDSQEIYQRRLTVYPSKAAADLPGRIQAEAEQLNSDTANRQFYLPDSMGSKKLHWYQTVDSTGWLLVCMALVLLGAMILVEQEKKREEQKKRAEQLDLEYPDLVSRMQMLLGAGLSMRMVLERIAADYKETCAFERRQSSVGWRKKEKKSLCCEEILISCRELENGLTEAEVYRRLGNRCGTASYRGLALLLEQNMTKGGKGLMELLEQEALEAYENRQRKARQAGEKVSVRLLVPMGMMLVIVLALIMIPAFLNG